MSPPPLRPNPDLDDFPYKGSKTMRVPGQSGPPPPPAGIGMSSGIKSGGWPGMRPVSPLPQPTLPKPSVGLRTGKVDAETGLSDSDRRVIEVMVLIPLIFGVGVLVGGLIR